MMALAETDVVLMTREMILSVDADMVVVRISSKGETAVHVGMDATRAMRIGAAFIRGALRVDPSLSMQIVDSDLERAKAQHLRAVPKAEGKA